MKIAYVSAGRLDSFMADVVHVLQSVDAMTQLGHEVTLFARHGDLDVDELQGRYGLDCSPRCELFRGRDWRPPWSRLTRVGNALAMSRKVRRGGKFDVLFGREPYSLWPLLGRGVPAIYEAHEMPGRFQLPLMRRMFSHPDFKRMIVISGSLRDDYLAAFQTLDPNKVRVIPNGVQRSAIDLPRNPVELPGRAAAPRIGFVGALYVGKGMEIIGPVARLAPSCDFHIVGGREADIAYWKSAGLPDNVYFHGLKPRSEIFAYLDAFDLVVLPSQPEIASFSGRKTPYGQWTSPMKLFEYMARGRAIIASDLPGIREVVEDGATACLVPPQDPSAWHAAIVHLVENPAIRERMGTLARERCASQFTTLVGARQRLEGVVS